MTDTAVVNAPEDRDHKRQLALLKATGLDRLSPEQRELTLAIAKRYDLDLMLRHVVTIDGKPFVTRDALLWIAHRSGQFDGITVTRPVVEDDFWYCEATVWRKDMSHPFTYGGRYPISGKNKTFAPEMAVKTAESMALRRAFNISAPSQDERWDAEVPAAEPEQPKSLAERAAERAARVSATETASAAPGPSTATTEQATEEEAVPEGRRADSAGATEQPNPEPATHMVQCESRSPLEADVQCRRETGHTGIHRSTNESWSEPR
jgi:hypothetical protein